MEHYDFIAVDFETANRNYNSACSIGIVAVRNFEIVKTYYSLINPNVEFEPSNIQIHGIESENVKNAPAPEELWFDIFHFFGPYAVLAHNAYFDMAVLKRTFPDAEYIDFKYIDTVSLCKEFVPGKKGLADCAEYFNINLGQHHNSLDDAVTCAKLAISCIKQSECQNLGELCFSLPHLKINRFSELNPPISAIFGKDKDSSLHDKVRALPTYHKIRPSDIQKTVLDSSINKDHPFFEKTLVFTGELSMGRKEAMQVAVNLGAIVKSSVTRKTNFLIVGEQDKTLVGEDGKSTKEKKAEALTASGAATIQIINEEQFFSIIQQEEHDEAACGKHG